MSHPSTERSGGATALLWTAKLAAAGILGYAGWLKLADHAKDIELFTALGMEPGGRLVIGALEMGAAALILWPGTAIFGALLGLGIMCGAIIGHLTTDVLSAVKVFGPLGVAVACVIILYLRRHDARFIRNLFDR